MRFLNSGGRTEKSGEASCEFRDAVEDDVEDKSDDKTDEGGDDMLEKSRGRREGLVGRPSLTTRSLLSS